MEKTKISGPVTTENNNDAGKWILGVFYFNPNDKRLFPPKRLPILGWTVNFANPLSILAMALLFTAVFLVGRYIKQH